MKQILASLVLLILLFGCAHNQGIIQKDEISYLKLTGNLENALLQIDEGQAFSIEKPDKDFVYEIKPGTHIVTVIKDGEVVVKRELFFDDQVTREVIIK